MNIQGAARLSNLPTKTIRYYEDVGLISPTRAPNGYRDFDRVDVDRLSFIARARRLGFSMEEVRTLLELQDDPSRRSAEVKALARAHLNELDRKLAELSRMREDLRALFEACPGNDGADCAILDGLGETKC